MTIKTFSAGTAKDSIKFDVDGDEFEAISPNSLPAGALAQYFEMINDGKLFTAHEVFFKNILTEDSYKLFEERLNSKEKPITIKVLSDISSWLLGDMYMGEDLGESKE